MENPIKMDDLEVPPFSETSTLKGKKTGLSTSKAQAEKTSCSSLRPTFLKKCQVFLLETLSRRNFRKDLQWRRDSLPAISTFFHFDGRFFFWCLEGSFKMYFVLKVGIFRCPVSFQGCNFVNPR